MSLYVVDRLVCRYRWSSIYIYIPDGHLHRVTYARCRIDTIDSPDDEHVVARNMKCIEINIYGTEFCVKLVIYENYIEMYSRHA